jgi:hypothetical protein
MQGRQPVRRREAARARHAAQRACAGHAGAASTTHLATEGAEELGMLRDLHLLDDLTQGRTIARPVLAGDPDLLRALRLHETYVC